MFDGLHGTCGVCGNHRVLLLTPLIQGGEYCNELSCGNGVNWALLAGLDLSMHLTSIFPDINPRLSD